MKKYTQEEFDAIPVDENGIRHCPTGDYTAIDRFGEGCSFGAACSFGAHCSFDEGCSFGEDCSFGEGCRFGEYCSFGEDCRFGEYCSFGAHCSFGEYCSFGEDCSFGEGCRFGAVCSFGAACRFGAHCSFGEGCSFGAVCRFGEGCICEFGQFVSMLSAGGFGSCGRTTYFFRLSDGGICVRCGCFAGTLDEWAAKVKQTHGDSQIAQAYLLLIPAIKVQFDEALCEMKGIKA